MRAQNGSLRGENDRFRQGNEKLAGECKALLKDNVALRGREEEMRTLVKVQMELLTPGGGEGGEGEAPEEGEEEEV